MPQPTTDQDMREQVCAILSEIKGYDVRPALAEQDDFIVALNLDSLDAVELTVRLGSDFGVEFGAEPEDLEALESLQSLVALVERRSTR